MIKFKTILKEEYKKILYRGIGKHTPVDEGMFGKGTYFTEDEKYAAQYGDIVIKAEVTLKNPFVTKKKFDVDKLIRQFSEDTYLKVKNKQISYKDYLEARANEITKILKEKGHDGIVIPHETIVFYPKQSIKNIKKIQNINENISYNNWVFPNDKSLKQEYDVEYKYHIKNKYGNIWKTFSDFKDSVKQGKIITVTPEIDDKINNRSKTDSYEQLISLIKSYRSFPKFRNENTIKELYKKFKENKPVDMPIIIDKKGHKEIMSGNTRMDIAFQLNIIPRAIIIKI